MAEIKKTEAAVKPVATIKTPVAAEVKTPEVKAPAKEEVKAETKKAAPAKKATAAKKTTAKKATAAKKPAAKKATATKATAAVKSNVVLQYGELNVTYDTIVTNAKNNYEHEMGGKIDEIKKLSIYVKPEEYAAYYVVNDKVQGRIGL
ncbi:MAG: hypothetical protein IJ260_11650 [Butyrivibrio sp.]|nr:hypothetical protein [Butyrivibrio sp.]